MCRSLFFMIPAKQNKVSFVNNIDEALASIFIVSSCDKHIVGQGGGGLRYDIGLLANMQLRMRLSLHSPNILSTTWVDLLDFTSWDSSVGKITPRNTKT